MVKVIDRVKLNRILEYSFFGFVCFKVLCIQSPPNSDDYDILSIGFLIIVVNIGRVKRETVNKLNEDLL